MPDPELQLSSSLSPAPHPHSTPSNAWRKGVSPNPGGITKEKRAILTAITDKLTDLLPEMVDILANWARSENPKASIPAAMYLMDRRLGKPTERREDTLPPAVTVWIGPFGQAPSVLEASVLPAPAVAALPTGTGVVRVPE